jgi:DNA replication and repair protein RecF
MDGLRGPRLLTLRVRNLRNLRSVDLDLRQESPRILLTGANGAGKTTLLEAVYLLARGRSFRGRKAGSLTTDGEHRTLIEGVFRESDSSSESMLVFERSSRGSLRRYNSVAMESRPPSESPLRVKLVGENPQALLEGEPILRRGLLDWNVFHVEHRLGQLRADLRRVLAQRNAALRQTGSGASFWDPTFVDLCDRITAKREAFVELWGAQFRSFAKGFSFLDGCDLLFERGWPQDTELTDILRRGRSAEVQRGQTLAGAHRADIRIGRDGAGFRLSRGQAKVTVCLLQLAAERVHLGTGLAPSLWLLDDIGAEIDRRSADCLRRLLGELGTQQLVARLSYETRDGFDGSVVADSMFHVEHGTLRPVALAERPLPPRSSA